MEELFENMGLRELTRCMEKTARFITRPAVSGSYVVVGCEVLRTYIGILKSDPQDASRTASLS